METSDKLLKKFRGIPEESFVKISNGKFKDKASHFFIGRPLSPRLRCFHIPNVDTVTFSFTLSTNISHHW